MALFNRGGEVGKVEPDSDVGLDMVGLVTKRGFPIETHYVTTSDGYILTMFRIPHNNKGPHAEGKSAPLGSPVLLQHGLLDSSYTWINNYEDESLGYIMSNAGYDVWFGNNRGNRYGRNHTTLNPDDGTSTFWEFSWDEMASLDIPAMINYVLTTTNYSTLSYVGHSEGTIQMFAAGSDLVFSSSSLGTTTTTLSPVAQAKQLAWKKVKDDVLKKINVFVALAPVAYVHNLRSKILVALANSDIINRFLNRGIYEFLPYGPIDQVAPEICQLVNNACDVFLMTICGPTRHVNSTRIQVYVSNTPAGTSTYNMGHWMQGVLTPTFQMMDWGSADANMARYGQAVPPTYDLTTFTIPTAIFNGEHDYLADVDDVARLLQEVPATSIVYQDTEKDYAHLDYTWAYDANVRIYNKVLRVIEKHTPAK